MGLSWLVTGGAIIVNPPYCNFFIIWGPDQFFKFESITIHMEDCSVGVKTSLILTFLVLVLVLVLSYVQIQWDFHFCAWSWSRHLRGAFHQAFCQCFSLTNFISYWNPCIWLAESKFVSEKHWQNAWWNAPLVLTPTLEDWLWTIEQRKARQNLPDYVQLEVVMDSRKSHHNAVLHKSLQTLWDLQHVDICLSLHPLSFGVNSSSVMNKWRVSSQNGLYPFWSILDIHHKIGYIQFGQF